jgi:dTDP-glucose 4,6-dehydratase
MKELILVTGGAGFLGSHLCDRLLDEGFAVVAMDNLITGSTDNIAHLIGHDDFRFVHHDVTEYIYLEGPLYGVVHFARTTSTTRSRRSRSARWAPTRRWDCARPRGRAS